MRTVVMKNFIQLLEILYTRLLLLDILGRFLPGYIFLWSVAFAMGGPQYAMYLFEEPGRWGGVLVTIGLSWVCGFALELFGETIGFIREYPKKMTREEWYKSWARFQLVTNEVERERAARFLSVTLICGTISTAAVLSFFLIIVLGYRYSKEFLFDRLYTPGAPYLAYLFLIAVFGGLVFYLRKAHIDYLARLELLLQSVITISGEQSPTDDSENKDSPDIR
jgi:hypothetical protein